MAIVTVNLVDTFDEWRLKTNSLGSNTGDLATLATTDKSSIVAAINEIHTDDSDDMEHLLDDTTPQLGGNLDLNSKDITGTGDINVTGSITATSFTGNILGSGSIAGTVTGTTQSASDNSTKLATTAYVDAQVATENTIAEMDDTTLASLAQGDFLIYNATTSVWENKTTSAVGILSDVIDDTTPQLGGDLDLNSKDITGTGNINVTGTLTATSIAGTVTGVTQSSGDDSTKLATTAYVDAATSSGGASESFAVSMAIALG